MSYVTRKKTQDDLHDALNALAASINLLSETTKAGFEALSNVLQKADSAGQLRGVLLEQVRDEIKRGNKRMSKLSETAQSMDETLLDIFEAKERKRARPDVAPEAVIPNEESSRGGGEEESERPLTRSLFASLPPKEQLFITTTVPSPQIVPLPE
jgi:hypothetical protein